MCDIKGKVNIYIIYISASFERYMMRNCQPHVEVFLAGPNERVCSACDFSLCLRFYIFVYERMTWFSGRVTERGKRSLLIFVVDFFLMRVVFILRSC